MNKVRKGASLHIKHFASQMNGFCQLGNYIICK